MTLTLTVTGLHNSICRWTYSCSLSKFMMLNTLGRLIILSATQHHPSPHCCQRWRDLQHTLSTNMTSIGSQVEARGRAGFLLLALPSGLQTNPLSAPDGQRKEQMEIQAQGFLQRPNFSSANQEWKTTYHMWASGWHICTHSLQNHRKHDKTVSSI